MVENGIGETRALLLKGTEVLAAKLHWPGELFAGKNVCAKIVSRTSGTNRGIAETDIGEQILLDHIPAGITEGSTVDVAITRAAIAEHGRMKLAHGRVMDSPGFAKESPFEGLRAKLTRSFPAGVWEDVWHSASCGQFDFAGGSAIFTVTPAMTLIDIDGEGSPRELALRANPAIATGLQWFDLGGNIGVDFPTIQSRADRKIVDTALEKALADWPHERTAMNGFGFVQIIARLEGPSMLHRFATSRIGMCARMALRIAEKATGIGPVVLLTIHPALKAKLKDEWIAELGRRTGKQVRIACDPGLALEAPQAQIVAP